LPQSRALGTETGGPGLAYGLDGISDWGPSQPFLNIMKTSRSWIGHLEGQWGGMEYEEMGAAGIVDADGYLTEMPSGVDNVETFILTDITSEATYTAGRYRLTYEGEGDIEVGGTAYNVVYGDGEVWFDYTPTDRGIVGISFSSTDPNGTGNYLRNFEVVKEEHIDLYEQGEIFNPLWIENIEDAHALRFMDWMETNHSEVETWEDLPTLSDYKWSDGVPIEVMVELANKTGTEPWFNIPHNADEDFIRQFAEYVRDNLNPDIRAHFEFSNEVWNWIFEQAPDSQADGIERFGVEHGDGWVQEYGARSAEMAHILNDVYAGHEDQLVKVIATHTGWQGLEEAILNAPAYVDLDPDNVAPHTLFDTYAITGYFSGNLGQDKAGTVLGWLDESLAAAEQDADALSLTGQARETYISDHRYDLATDRSIREIRDGSVTGDSSGSLQELFQVFEYHAAVAEEYGLDLVMYEGGTHVVATGAYMNNEALADFFIHLNYSEGMGDIYAELLEGWVEAGGTLFNAFVDVAQPSKHGSWGNLRHLEDQTARHDALEEFAETYPRVDQGGIPADPSDPAPEGGVIDGSEDQDVIGPDHPDRTENGDIINGNGGNDIIYDGMGSDTIDGGAGYDLLTFIDDGNQVDIIENFEPDSDTIDLSQRGIYSLSQVIAQPFPGSSDLMLDFAGDRIVIRGGWDIEAEMPRISEDNFDLAEMPGGADPDPLPIPFEGEMPEGYEPTVPGEDPTTDPDPDPEPVPGTMNVREYIFGHEQLNNDQEGASASVPWWIDAFTDASLDASYAFAGQYGYLQQHDDLPPNAHWGFEGVDTAWDQLSGETFAEAGFTHVTITPETWLQGSSPDQPYWEDPNTTPITATLDIIDFVTSQAPGVKVLIYENMPDMSAYATSWPPTREEFDAWGAHLKGSVHDWWVDYESSLQEARPGADIELIPTGSLVFDMIQSDSLGLDAVPLDAFFANTSAVGTPSLFFLSSIVQHAALYGRMPPVDFNIPSDVHPDVAAAYPDILDFVASEMNITPDETPVDPPVIPDTDWTDPNVDWADPDNYDEILLGSDDEDRITTGDADEFIQTGAGNDLMYGSAGSDRYDGGDGKGDRVQYTDASGIIIDMNDALASTGSAYGDTFVNIERIQGSDGDDTIRLSSDTTGYGKGGNDTIVDADGREIMRGHEGMDMFVFQTRDGEMDIILDYEIGVDTINLLGWNATWEDLKISGTEDGRAIITVAGDSLAIDDAWDPVTGTYLIDRDDLLLMPSEPPEPIDPVTDWTNPDHYDAHIYGTSKEDRFQPGPENTYISTGAGNDLIYGSAGANHYDGGEGLGDRVQYEDAGGVVVDMNDPFESTGSAYGDTFANIERLQGSAGDDTFFLAADTTGYGKGGDDIIVDSSGREIMRGDAGRDMFVFKARDGESDIIRDYEAGIDEIDLRGWVTTWDELEITGQDNGRAYVSVEGDTLIINDGWDVETGTHLLDRDDFIF